MRNLKYYHVGAKATGLSRYRLTYQGHSLQAHQSFRGTQLGPLRGINVDKWLPVCRISESTASG